MIVVAMNSVWKMLLATALVLAVSGFVVGTRVASSAGDPGPREPVRIQPVDDTSRGPVTPPRATEDDDEDDDTGVEVVRPQPEDLDDITAPDDDDDGDDDDDDDDDSDDDERGDDDD